MAKVYCTNKSVVDNPPEWASSLELVYVQPYISPPDKTSTEARGGTETSPPIFTQDGSYTPPIRKIKSKTVQRVTSVAPVILWHCDSVVSVDDVNYPHDETGRQWSASFPWGNDLLVTSEKKFGIGSYDLSQLGKIFAENSQDFNFRSSDFEIAMMFYHGTPAESHPARHNFYIGDNNTTTILQAVIDASIGITFTVALDSGSISLSAPSSVLIANDWNHVVFYRTGNTFGIGANGEELDAAESSSSMQDISTYKIWINWWREV